MELLQRKQPEVIYHLAAQSNPHASLADPRGTWAINLGGTLNLLEAVKAAALNRAPRVILVSSGVCYGNPTAEFTYRSVRIALCDPITLMQLVRLLLTSWVFSIILLMELRL